MSFTMFDLCNMKCWRCGFKRCVIRINKYGLKLRDNDTRNIQHMEHNLEWFEKALIRSKFDYETFTKALAFVKSDLNYVKRQLVEILKSDLMRQASTFMGAERAMGRWQGQLSVVLEVLGLPQPEAYPEAYPSLIKKETT